MMATRIFHSQTYSRPLYIDFNAYTDGDDSFKQELVKLMISNLTELKEGLHLALKDQDPGLFHKVSHKVKLTIHMLGDNELTETIDLLKVMLTDSVRVSLLDSLCTDIIDSLKKQ